MSRTRQAICSRATKAATPGARQNSASAASGQSGARWRPGSRAPVAAVCASGSRHASGEDAAGAQQPILAAIEPGQIRLGMQNCPFQKAGRHAIAGCLGLGQGALQVSQILQVYLTLLPEQLGQPVRRAAPTPTRPV